MNSPKHFVQIKKNNIISVLSQLVSKGISFAIFEV